MQYCSPSINIVQYVPPICLIIVQYFILLVTHLQNVSARVLNVIVQYLILTLGSGSVKMLSDTNAACVAINLAKCLKNLPLDQKMIQMNTTKHVSKNHNRFTVE